jgi:hypothetical protein
MLGSNTSHAREAEKCRYRAAQPERHSTRSRIAPGSWPVSDEERNSRLRLEILTILVTTRDAMRKLDRATDPVSVRLALARAARALQPLGSRVEETDDEELRALYREAARYLRDSSLLLICLVSLAG